MNIQNEPFEVQDFSSEKKYFTNIPNIIFTLRLSPYELTLYCFLKKIAGENGKSWMFNKNLCANLNMSLAHLKRCKNSLALPRKELNGKSLIVLEPRKTEDQTCNLSTLITLTDIWPENIQIFSKGVGSDRAGVGSDRATRRRTKENKNQERERVRACEPIPKTPNVDPVGSPPPISSPVKEKKEKPPAPSFKSFGEYGLIQLSKEQFSKIAEQFSLEELKESITNADAWLKAEGKTKKDYCAFLKNWIRRDRARKISYSKPSQERLDANIAFTKILIEKNISFMKERGFNCYFGKAYVEITHKDHIHALTVNYNEKTFKQLLEHGFRKRNLRI